MRNGERNGFIGDIYGGLTAAVVALPLALAFGVASGVGAIAGLYGAIAVGFFAAVVGGTPSQFSDPTSPMTVVMATIVAQFADNLHQAFAIVVLGGLLQIGFGLMRVGRHVSSPTYTVVSGFMSGDRGYHHTDPNLAVCRRCRRQWRTDARRDGMADRCPRHQHRCTDDRIDRARYHDLLAPPVRLLSTCTVRCIDRRYTGRSSHIPNLPRCR